MTVEELYKKYQNNEIKLEDLSITDALSIADYLEKEIEEVDTKIEIMKEIIQAQKNLLTEDYKQE